MDSSLRHSHYRPLPALGVCGVDGPASAFSGAGSRSWRVRRYGTWTRWWLDGESGAALSARAGGGWGRSIPSPGGPGYARCFELRDSVAGRSRRLVAGASAGCRTDGGVLRAYDLFHRRVITGDMGRFFRPRFDTGVAESRERGSAVAFFSGRDRLLCYDRPSPP